MSTHRIWLTRANGLTFLRLLAAPALALAVLDGAAPTAAALFWLAVATDVADGRVARRYGEVSAYGRLVDHAADATFVSIGSAALAWSGVLPIPLSPLIAIAFFQYAIDSHIAGLPGASREPPRPLERHRVLRRRRRADRARRLGLAWPGPALVQGLGWLLVATTLVSMMLRLRFALSTE